MWRDINIDFGMKINGDIADETENLSIQHSLTNIWKTMPGSRRMLYPFASPSWGLLFEQIDETTARQLGELLLKAIQRWEDRIVVENLHIVPHEDENLYRVTLTYRVISDGDATHIFQDVIRPV